MKKRDISILEIITKHQRIEVAKLAELLSVSQVTMRKDLDALEERGLIKREHGYALIASTDDISNRLAFNYEIKRRIAQKAAKQVKDGETVMIESGSCCALLAEELAKNKLNITIITNSAFIAGYIRKYPGAKIVLLGGNYQNESQVMVGAITRKCAEDFFVDKLFIGTDGFIEQAGFTGTDHSRAETVRDMAKQAQQVVILTESLKFSQQGVVLLMPTEKVSLVITDSDIPKSREKILIDNKVKLFKVDKTD